MLTCEAVYSPVTKAGVSRSQRKALLALADKLSPKMRKAFIKAMDELKSATKLADLKIALMQGSEEAVLRALGIEELAARLGALTDNLNSAVAQAGALTAQQAAAGSAGLKVLARFDVMAPGATRFLGQYNMDLITRISNEQRLLVRQVLMDMFQQRMSPTTAGRQLRSVLTDDQIVTRTAQHLKSMVGLTAQQAQAVMNYRRQLEAGDRSGALGRTLVRGNEARTINAAMRDGTMNASKIDALVSSYSDRMLAFRAQTIAQNESFRALANGQRLAWEQALSQNRSDLKRSDVKRFWVATNDAHTRDSHRELVEFNSEGVGIDEPFKFADGSTIMFPHDPNAPASETINCRCTVVYRFTDVSDADLPPVVGGRSYYPAKEAVQ